MHIECPDCTTFVRVPESPAPHLHIAVMKCPCCGRAVVLRRPPVAANRGYPPVVSTRCAILSARKKLRLYNITRPGIIAADSL